MNIIRKHLSSLFARLLLTVCFMLIGNGMTIAKVSGRHAVMALMDSAEQIMNDNPDRAYVLMDSIDSGSIRNRSLQARYALLYSEAQYKNYIDETNDSLIMIAVRYYSANKDVLSRFLSFYYLGCIYHNNKSYIDAAVALSEAEELVENIDDHYRLGLLYTQLGNVFYESFDFFRAKEYYQKAMDNYDKAGKERHYMYAIYYLSGCMKQFNDYGKAHKLLDQALEWAEKNNDQQLVVYCLVSQLSCSLYTNDLEKSDVEMNRCLSFADNRTVTPMEYSKYVQYYTMRNDYSSALSYLEKGWASSATRSDSIELWWAESLLYEKMGNLEKAINSYKHSIELQNNNLRVVLDQPVVGAQKEYYKTLAQVESLKASRNLHLVLSIIILAVFLLILIHITNRTRVFKMEAEMQDYMLTIKELKLNDDLKDQLVNEKNRRINSLFSNQFAELDEIFKRLIEFEAFMPADNLDYKITANFYKQIRAKLEDLRSPKNQIELKRIINGNYNNIMDRLAEKDLNLTNNDQLILLFLISGFSPKVVAHIVSEPQKIIYQKRTRIVARIDQKFPDLANEIRNILKYSQKHSTI